MGEWRKRTLKSLTSKIGSGATPTGGDSAYKASGTSLIRSQNVLDFRFSLDGLAYIDDEQSAKLKNVSVEPRDILINITGDSVARSCMVDPKILPARVNQHVAIIRADVSEAVPSFLLYALLFKKEELLTISEIGATRRALTKGLLESFEIDAPLKDEQRAVAEILSSLDDKIDLLSRQNKILEALAETVVDQYLLEESVAPPEAVTTLEDLIRSVSITHKFPNETVTFLNTSDISRGFVSKTDPVSVSSLPGQAKKSIQKGDILFSEIRPANGRFAYIDFFADEYVVSTKLMVLRAIDEKFRSLVYFYLTHPRTLGWLQMVAEGRSGTFPQITFDQVKTLAMNLPKQETLEDCIGNFDLWLTKMVSNQRSIRRLEAIRDTLLPKLMSGDVRVEYEAAA